MKKYSSKISVYDAIVVGTGISGLKCTRKLVKNGWNVLTLESENRVGGRLFSVEFPLINEENDETKDTVEIDLGGSWLHDPENNPIFKKLKDPKSPYSVDLLQKTDYSLPRPLAKMDSSVIYLEGKRVASEKIDEIEKLVQSFSDFLDENEKKFSKEELSQQQVIEIFSKKHDYSDEQKKWLNFGMELIVCSDNGVELRKITGSKNFVATEETTMKSDYIWYPKSYYSVVIDELKKGANIKLREKVTSIDYSQKIVSVTAQLENGEEKIYYARRVCVTVPIGVLKNKVISFNPSLPSPTLQAIDNFNRGHLEKVILSFKWVFWLSDFETLIFWKGKVKYEFMSYAKFPVRDGRHHQPLLILLPQGDQSKRFNTLPKDEIINELLSVLEDAYGDAPKNSFLRAEFSGWGSKPSFWGSYSSPGPKSKPGDHKLIAGPFGPYQGLVMAGEAVSRQADYDNFGTVHGAYISGEEAAGEMDRLDMPLLTKIVFTGIPTPWPLSWVLKTVSNFYSTLINYVGSSHRFSAETSSIFVSNSFFGISSIHNLPEVTDTTSSTINFRT